jgi:predicted ribosomally synthesized peptide with SipW-like signal peptide
MESTQKTHRHRRRGLLALLVAGTALISASGATMSLALFTDSASANGNAFTTGTIHIGIVPAATILSAPAMMPGDTVNGSVVVSNTGTAQLRYAISGAATNTDTKGLAAQITITIKTVDSSGPGPCGLFNGTVTLFTGAVPYVEGNLFGTFASHPNGGRALLSGANETLCFRATLPSTVVDPNLQGATTTMTFKFYAEQTANN